MSVVIAGFKHNSVRMSSTNFNNPRHNHAMQNGLQDDTQALTEVSVEVSGNHTENHTENHIGNHTGSPTESHRESLTGSRAGSGILSSQQQLPYTHRYYTLPKLRYGTVFRAVMFVDAVLSVCLWLTGEKSGKE